MKYSVIILAAGSGTRMNLGFNKMFLTIDNIPLVCLSSKKFFNDKNCKQIIYVINENEENTINEILIKEKLIDERCTFVIGGKERQYSVYNGLQEVINEIVLVHDAARPFINEDLINSLISNAKIYGCTIPAVKVKDTIKLVENEFVKETLPRHLLYAVQTPQACLTSLLKFAHNEAKKENYLGTDEASLIEKYSKNKVKIIEGNYDNIKLTTQDDINLANNLYIKYFKEEK